jgi:hypothetical protein
VDEWAADPHRQAELEPLVGEVVRVGEALVLRDGDVAVMQMGADGRAGGAVLQTDADGRAGGAVLQTDVDVRAGGAVVRRRVAEPHAAAVAQAEPTARLAVDVAVSSLRVRPVAVQGEGAELARPLSPKPRFYTRRWQDETAAFGWPFEHPSCSPTPARGVGFHLTSGPTLR